MPKKHNHMTLVEFAREAGVTKSDVTYDLYLYTDCLGRPTFTQKPNRTEIPIDQFEPFGYAMSYDYDLLLNSL